MTFTVKLANLDQGFDQTHSIATFDTSDDAVAYWWAVRFCLYPQRAWILSGLDGWQCNDHLIGKEFPPRLAEKIQKAIEEDNEITIGELGTDGLDYFNHYIAGDR